MASDIAVSGSHPSTEAQENWAPLKMFPLRFIAKALLELMLHLLDTADRSKAHTVSYFKVCKMFLCGEKCEMEVTDLRLLV